MKEVDRYSNLELEHRVIDILEEGKTKINEQGKEVYLKFDDEEEAGIFVNWLSNLY